MKTRRRSSTSRVQSGPGVARLDKRPLSALPEHTLCPHPRGHLLCHLDRGDSRGASAVSVDRTVREGVAKHYS